MILTFQFGFAEMNFTHVFSDVHIYAANNAKDKLGEHTTKMMRWMEEILHQMIGGVSHYLKGFNNPRWCRISQQPIAFKN